MKKLTAPVVLCLRSLLMAGAAPKQRAGSTPPAAPSSGAVAQAPEFGSVPIYFIPNQRQTGAEAAYYARASRYTLWLTRTGLRLEEGSGDIARRSLQEPVRKRRP